MSNSTGIINRRFFFLPGFLFLFPGLLIHAQKPHLDIKPVQKVTPIGMTQVMDARTIVIGNLTETIYRSPNTHALVQAASTIDYSAMGAGVRMDLIFFDIQKKPAYISSVTTDPNGIPLKAIEETRVLNNLTAGYKWSNQTGNQYSYNFSGASKKYETTAFTASYKPVLKAPAYSIEYGGVSNTTWMQKISDALAKKIYNETKQDDSYGKGGTSVYSYRPFDGLTNIEIENIDYKDANGIVRERIYREYYSDGFMYEEVTYYDCSGQAVHFDSSMFDDYGEEYEYTEIEYKNGKPVVGYRDIEDEDEEGYYEYREYYNPETGRFERDGFTLPPLKAFLSFEYKGPDRETCGDFPRNVIYLGASWLREDSKPAINLFGALGNYTRFLNPKIGVTAEVGYNAGSMSGTNYSKLLYMAGLTYVPFNCAALNDKYTISVHALAGMVDLKSKYGMYSNSQNYFNAVIGPRFDYNFGKVYGGIQFEVNPVFPKGGGNTSLNYRTSLGGRFSF